MSRILIERSAPGEYRSRRSDLEDLLPFSVDLTALPRKESIS